MLYGIVYSAPTHIVLIANNAHKKSYMMLEHVINYVCESGVSISTIPLIQDFDPSNYSSG